MKALKLAVGLFFAVCIFACKPPKPGDKCTGNVASCSDKTSAMACIKGAYIQMSCRGPQGCVKAGAGAVTCDDTIAQVTDGCDEDNEVACQIDKKAALKCQKNVFVVDETCNGPKGCVVNGEKIACDNDKQEDASAPDQAKPLTVTLKALDTSNEYDGKLVCACGFVQSSGSSPGHTVDGSRANVLHNIYVGSVATPTDDNVGSIVVCASFGAALPKVKDGQKICVQGTRQNAFVGNGTGKGIACTVVPSCP